MRSSLDFTVVETNTYLYLFCRKRYMTWTDLSINCFKLHEYEYLDRIHIVPSQTNILSEEISKRNLNLFSSEYIVLAKYFLQDKQETSKLYPWQLPRLPLCWRDLTIHWYCTRLKVCLFKTYQLQMNLGHNDPLEIIQLSLKWGTIQIS